MTNTIYTLLILITSIVLYMMGISAIVLGICAEGIFLTYRALLLIIGISAFFFATDKITTLLRKL